MSKEAWKYFFITAASGVFIGAALFDVFPEIFLVFGYTKTTLLFVGGFVLWHLLKKCIDIVSKSSFAIISTLAFWLHSALEGAAIALGFSVNITIGTLVALGMLLHLFPEFFAVVGILRGEGVSTRRSIIVDVLGIALLFFCAMTLTLFFKNFSSTALDILGGIGGGAFFYIGLMSFMKRKKTRTNIVGFLIGLIISAMWKIKL